jgi:eukaryotic-like serine/threonine-protein kinase
LLLVGAGVVGLRLASAGSGRKAADDRTIRFLLPLPEKTAFGTYDQPVLSPDGKRIVFSAKNDKPGFFVHSLETLETRYFPGPEEFISPFWSPDGRFVAFLSNRTLKKVDLLSGSVTTICEAGLGFGGAWNQDDVILFGGNGGLMRVSATGGIPVPVTAIDSGKGETFHSWPSFLPDHDHFLFSVAASRTDIRGDYIGSLSSGPPRRILPGATNAQYSPLGYVIFNRAILAGPAVRRSHLRLAADPFVIAHGVAGISNLYFSAFSIAGDSLVYRTDSGLSVTRLEWRDRKGKLIGTVCAPADYSNPALSPDGRMLAVSERDPSTRTRDTWLFDLARGTDRRLTFDPADDTSPTWSPDGQRIMFTSDRKGHRNVWQKEASGAHDEEPVLESNTESLLDDWTHNGRYLIFGNIATGMVREEWALPLFGNRKPFAVIRGPATVQGAQVSPNGKWIAYASDESGKQEIYVENFPAVGGKWQVSTDGGIEP